MQTKATSQQLVERLINLQPETRMLVFLPFYEGNDTGIPPDEHQAIEDLVDKAFREGREEQLEAEIRRTEQLFKAFGPPPLAQQGKAGPVEEPSQN